MKMFLVSYIYTLFANLEENIWLTPSSGCTDKKENKFFLINKESQKGAVAKPYCTVYEYMTNGLLIYD
jgi:hypothetical protein